MGSGKPEHYQSKFNAKMNPIGEFKGVELNRDKLDNDRKIFHYNGESLNFKSNNYFHTVTPSNPSTAQPSNQVSNPASNPNNITGNGMAIVKENVNNGSLSFQGGSTTILSGNMNPNIQNMNSSMNPGMNPTMNPTMNSTMNSSMNPGMNQSMNPSMNQVMNQNMQSIQNMQNINMNQNMNSMMNSNMNPNINQNMNPNIIQGNLATFQIAGNPNHNTPQYSNSIQNQAYAEGNYTMNAPRNVISGTTVINFQGYPNHPSGLLSNQGSIHPPQTKLSNLPSQSSHPNASHANANHPPRISQSANQIMPDVAQQVSTSVPEPYNVTVPPPVSTTLTPFHLNCQYTRRRICHCSQQYNVSNQKLIWDLRTPASNLTEKSDSKPNGDSTIDDNMVDVDSTKTKEEIDQTSNNESTKEISNVQSSYLTHDLYLLWKKRFPNFEKEVLNNQRRPPEDENGDIIPESLEISSKDHENNMVTGSRHYISVPKSYYNTQEKQLNESNANFVDRRRKTERTIYVPLQRQDGQVLPVRWDLWKLELYLQSVHGPEKAPSVLRELLEKGEYRSPDEMEKISKAKRSQFAMEQASKEAEHVHHPYRPPQTTSQPIPHANAPPATQMTKITFSQHRPTGTSNRQPRATTFQFPNLIPYNPQGNKK